MKKNTVLRSLSALLLCAFVLPLFCVGVSADIFESNMPKAPVAANVTSVYVYNIENDKTLLSYNPKGLIYPSSLTKIMSFIVISEKLGERLDESITVTSEMLSGTVGTRLGILAGEVFTVRQLMYCAFCGCYNDAVNILASVASGDTKNFVAEMNQKALALGLESTVFRNPTGIHDDAMVTTMNDLAIICRVAAEDQLIMQITGTERFEIPKSDTTPRYMIYNRNMLISARSTAEYFNGYANGLNAGMTVEGGECLATVASRDGLSYVIIVTGGETLEDDSGEEYISSYRLANELIDWCLDGFGYVRLFDSTVPCADINVSFSKGSDKVSVVPTEEIVMYLPLSFDPTDKLVFKLKLDSVEFEAPIKEGDIVGTMAVMYRDELIGEVRLATTADVERDDFLYGLEQIKIFSQSRIFLLSLLCLIGYSLLFTIVSAILKHSQTKNEKKPHK